MDWKVVFTPEAEERLAVLYRYLASAASPRIASRYTEALVNYCESLRLFPERGARRDDLRPGLRVTHFRGRTVIVFAVKPFSIDIVAFYHGERKKLSYSPC